MYALADSFLLVALVHIANAVTDVFNSVMHMQLDAYFYLLLFYKI
uniref:Uncharacterized protein n=1 Tax=Anguilla anguilla TaxID=7936 RepID=A0A0E9XC45_ANGAN